MKKLPFLVVIHPLLLFASCIAVLVLLRIVADNTTRNNDTSNVSITLVHRQTLSSIADKTDPKTIQQKPSTTTTTASTTIDFYTTSVPLPEANLRNQQNCSLQNAVNVRTHVVSFHRRVLFFGDSLANNLFERLRLDVLPPHVERRTDLVVKRNGYFTRYNHETALLAWAKMDCQPRLTLPSSRPMSDSRRTGFACAYTPTEVQRAQQRLPQFDILVYRIPWPHMYPWEGVETIERDFDPAIGIVKEQLDESLAVTHAMFGVSTVILPTVPFSSNVRTEQHAAYFHRDNAAIRSYVASYNKAPSVPGILHVLLLDFEKLTNALITENGKLMGLSPEQSFHVKLKRILETPERTWTYYPLAAMVCQGVFGVAPKHLDRECPIVHPRGVKTTISPDGMHWNDLYVRPRINAALLCLMNCVVELNRDDDAERIIEVERCQDGCNLRYMGLDPLVNGS